MFALRQALKHARNHSWTDAQASLPKKINKDQLGHLRLCVKIIYRCAEKEILRKYFEANIPAHFLAFHADLYPSPQALKTALAVPIPCPIDDEGERVQDYRGGVILHGPTAKGKTRAGFALTQAWCTEDPSITFQYVTAPNLKRTLAEAARAGSLDKVLDELVGDSDHVLFIDDLSQVRLTASLAENLFELIDRIHRERRMLVVTVQSTGDDLVRKWCADDKELTDTAQAIARRLREYCVPVRFDGKSKENPARPSPAVM